MALIAAYRFEETGNNDRVGQVGGEPNLPVVANNWSSTAGLLNDAAVSTDGGAFETYTVGTLAGIRSVSISIWVKPVSGFGRIELSESGNLVSLYFGDNGISPASASIQSSMMDSVFVNGTTPDGNWRHFVLTFNNSTGEAKLYENGSLVDTQTNASVVFSADKTSINLNAPNTGELQCDMLLIYDSVIDSTTVSDLYNGGAGYDPTMGGGGGGSTGAGLLLLGVG